MTKLHLNVGGGYDIFIGKGLLGHAEELIDIDRTVAVVTDTGVPREYAECIAAKVQRATIITIPMGEESKTLSTYSAVLSQMMEFGLTRADCVVAVGGGLVGDLAGFAAASYMRGIDFYNVPTTTLSQLDSSIGGKVAVNLDGVKNIVGAFHQPRGVIIDTDALKTLDVRQYTSGLVEAVKMALTCDEELFCMIEREGISEKNLEKVILGALKIKKAVVENDERELGLRKVLNFGHTFGHGVESQARGGMYHGECVAIGMLPMCASDVRKRLEAVLKRIGVYSEAFDLERALSVVSHDKKARKNEIDTVTCKAVGSYEFCRMQIDDYKQFIRENFKI